MVKLALEMKRLGVPNTTAGRQMLWEHVACRRDQKGTSRARSQISNGNFEVRESLFIGPSGKAAKFESTFQVLDDGMRRLITVIPFH